MMAWEKPSSSNKAPANSGFSRIREVVYPNSRRFVQLPVMIRMQWVLPLFLPWAVYLTDAGASRLANFPAHRYSRHGAGRGVNVDRKPLGHK